MRDLYVRKIGDSYITIDYLNKIEIGGDLDR
jgi:hypothetical protein